MFLTVIPSNVWFLFPCIPVFYCMLVILHQNLVLNMRPGVWEQFLPGRSPWARNSPSSDPLDVNPDHKQGYKLPYFLISLIQSGVTSYWGNGDSDPWIFCRFCALVSASSSHKVFKTQVHMVKLADALRAKQISTSTISSLKKEFWGPLCSYGTLSFPTRDHTLATWSGSEAS